MIKTVFMIAIVVMAASFLFTTTSVNAANLPSYAQGDNLNSKVDSKGRDITNVVTAVAVIVCIIGLFASAALFGSGQGDHAKRVFIGAVIGLILTALAYAIAATAIK